jgi:hypothetical protein
VSSSRRSLTMVAVMTAARRVRVRPGTRTAAGCGDGLGDLAVDQERPAAATQPRLDLAEVVEGLDGASGSAHGLEDAGEVTFRQLS